MSIFADIWRFLAELVIRAKEALVTSLKCHVYRSSREMLRWFNRKKNLEILQQSNTIGFIIKDRLDTGNYVVVNGLFNQTNNVVIKSETVLVNHIGPRLMRQFTDDVLLVTV